MAADIASRYGPKSDASGDCDIHMPGCQEDQRRHEVGGGCKGIFRRIRALNVGVISNADES
jgi:hypothetical protein